MSDKTPTQAMPNDGREGAFDGTNQPGTASPQRGAGGKRKGGFRGGQSEMAYHGPGQLGEQQVGDHDNPNAPAGSD